MCRIVQSLAKFGIVAAGEVFGGRFRALLGSQGLEPSQTQFVRMFLSHEREKFGRVVRELGMMLD